MTGRKSRPLKPASHEADFGFQESLPRIAFSLNLQLAHGWLRLNPIE
jgi:hypothetical protein